MMLTDNSSPHDSVAVDGCSDAVPTGIRLLRATGPLPDISVSGAPATKNARILIVDDDAAVLRLLGSYLGDTYHCEFACDAEHALEMLETSSYDIAILDIVMPRISGVSLLKQIRASAPSVIVMLMTGIQDSRLAIESIRKGAFDFIMKPFGMDEVEMSVQRALRFKEILDEIEVYQSRLESLVVERTASLQDENERLSGSLLETTLSFHGILHEIGAALEARDIEARGHTERVVAYAARLGKQLGLPYEELVALEQGALLHDIGTIFVPEDILRKPVALTEEEWVIVKRHPEMGGRMLRRSGMLANVACLVEQHHEHWDGSGYPNGLREEQIDIKARIFTVADCLDSMLSERPYRKSQTLGEAASEVLRCKGRQFDPLVVDAFFDVPIEEWRRIRERPITEAVSITGPLNPRVVESA